MSQIQQRKKRSSREETLLSLAQEDYSVPDLKAARAYGDSKSFKLFNEETQQLETPEWDVKTIGMFGSGIYLYFEFLKFWSIAFFVLFLLQICSIYLNYNGSEEFPQLLKLSLGNQKRIRAIDIMDIDLTEVSSDYQKIAAIIYSDFLTIVFFILFGWYYSKKSGKLAGKLEKDSITTSDYTLKITGVPHDTSEEELFGFFNQQIQLTKKPKQKPGKLIEVNFARDFKGHLFEFKELSKINIEVKTEEFHLRQEPTRSRTKLQTLEKEFETESHRLANSIYKAFGKKITSLSQYPIMHAYVVFDNLEEKTKVYQKLMELNSRARLNHIFFCCKKKLPKKHLLRQRILLKTNLHVDDPSDIKWENLDIGAFQQIFRRIITYISLLALILLSALALIITNTVKVQKCVEPVYTLADLDSVIALDSATSSQCFCSQMSTAYLSSSDQDLITLCKPFIAQTYLPYVFMVGAALITIIVNALLTNLLHKFGTFSRYKTESEEQKSVMSTIFIAQFINTAIIPMIVVWDFSSFNFTPAVSITKFIGPYIAKWTGLTVNTQEQDYYVDEVSFNWYEKVGSQYCVNLLIMCVHPWILNWLILDRVYKCSRDSAMAKAKIHKDAKKYSKGPPFLLTGKQAGMLSVVFIGFSFSSAVPIILLMTSIILGTTYLYEKHYLLKYNSKDTAVDSSINDWVLKVIKYACFLHLVCSIFAYSYPCLFPYNKDLTCIPSPHENINQNAVLTVLKNIYWKRRAHPFSYLFCLILEAFLFHLVVLFVIWVMKLFFFGRFKCFESKEEFADGQGNFSDEIQVIKSGGLSTYDMKDNEHYTELILALEKLCSNLQKEEQNLPNKVQDIAYKDTKKNQNLEFL